MEINNKLLNIRMLCFMDKEYTSLDEEQQMEVKSMLAVLLRIARKKKHDPFTPIRQDFMKVFWFNNTIISSQEFKTLTKYEKKEYSWRK